MKIRITVLSLKSGNSWTEDYDRVEITTLEQAETWAENLIKWFNETAKPGESHRQLLDTSIVGDSTAHDWYKRTDGMSLRFRDMLVDIYQCAKCGITGKRISLGGSIHRDSKYKAKKYKICQPDKLT